MYYNIVFAGYRSLLSSGILEYPFNVHGYNQATKVLKLQKPSVSLLCRDAVGGLEFLVVNFAGREKGATKSI